MVQIARPDSDISAGSWTPEGSTAETTLWESIDEVSANDGVDYIEATDNFTCEIGLDSSITDPGGNTGYFLRCRMQGNGSGGPERVQIVLFEGATQRAISGFFVNRASWVDKFYELTTGEADAITAFTDLRLKVIASNLGVAAESMWVTQAFFEVPDAAGGIVPQAFDHLAMGHQ